MRRREFIAGLGGVAGGGSAVSLVPTCWRTKHLQRGGDTNVEVSSNNYPCDRAWDCGVAIASAEAIAVPRKQRDHAAAVGAVAILLGLIIIGGISYTYMTRPALIEAATKRVLNIRQLFEDTFH